MSTYTITRNGTITKAYGSDMREYPLIDGPAHFKAGDVVRVDIEGDQARLTKVEPKAARVKIRAHGRTHYFTRNGRPRAFCPLGYAVVCTEHGDLAKHGAVIHLVNAHKVAVTHLERSHR